MSICIFKTNPTAEVAQLLSMGSISCLVFARLLVDYMRTVICQQVFQRCTPCKDLMCDTWKFGCAFGSENGGYPGYYTFMVIQQFNNRENMLDGKR